MERVAADSGGGFFVVELKTAVQEATLSVGSLEEG